MSIEQTYANAPARRTRTILSLRASYDLLLLIGLALLLPLLPLAPLPWLRVPLGLVLALFVPGYALTAALFPRRTDIDGVVRCALSFGLSAALLALLALLLDALPWGIKPWPITVGLAALILLLALVALGVRWALNPDATLYAPPLLDASGWGRSRGRVGRAGAVAGLLAAVGGIWLFSWLLLAPDPAGQTTEFYILGQQGLAEDYLREAAPGQELTITLGIANRERTARSYRVEVWASGDSATDQRQPVAPPQTLTLAAGAVREQPITWRMSRPGSDQQVEFLLFVEGAAQPYRRLQLWLNKGYSDLRKGLPRI